MEVHTHAHAEREKYFYMQKSFSMLPKRIYRLLKKNIR